MTAQGWKLSVYIMPPFQNVTPSSKTSDRMDIPTQCQELLSYSVSRWNDTASNRWVSLCTAMRDYEAKQPRSVIDLPSGSVPQDRHLSSRAISCRFSVTELPSHPDVDHRLRVFGRGSVTRTDGLIQHQVFE